MRELLDQQDAGALGRDRLDRGHEALDDDGREPERSSSTRRMLGRETSAWASTSICCSPPESGRACAFQRVFELREELDGVADPVPSPAGGDSA